MFPEEFGMWCHARWPYRIARVAVLLLGGDFLSRPLLGAHRWQDEIQLLAGATVVACGVAVGWTRRSALPPGQTDPQLVGVALSVMGLLIALDALLFRVSH